MSVYHLRRTIGPWNNNLQTSSY